MKQVMLEEFERQQVVHMLKRRKAEALRIVNHADPKMVKTPERQMQRHVANGLQKIIDKFEAARELELPIITPRQIFTIYGEPLAAPEGEYLLESDKDFVNDNLEAAAILLEAEYERQARERGA